MDYKNLIERLREHGQSWAAYEDIGLSQALEDAATAIETLLAEREAAVRQGHWVEYNGAEMGGKAWTCSECGLLSYAFMFGRQIAKYCPHCGAKMDLQNGHTPTDRKSES